MDGPAVVFLAWKPDFQDLLDGPNLSNFSYECAVNIELPPYEFENRCCFCVPVKDSIAILNELGYRLPTKLPDLGALTQALLLSNRMLSEDIGHYVDRCQQFPAGE